VWIACGRRQRIFLDVSGLWIETPQLSDPLRGIPYTSVRSEDDSVRSRCGRRRRIIRIFPVAGSIGDEAILLVCIPDDSVAAYGRIMRERFHYAGADTR